MAQQPRGISPSQVDPLLDPAEAAPITQQALPTPPTQVDLVNQSKDEADEAIAVASVRPAFQEEPTPA